MKGAKTNQRPGLSYFYTEIINSIDNWNTYICNQCYNTSPELRQALEKMFAQPETSHHKKKRD